MAEPIKTEQWKVIKDYPAYAVSNYGRVKRIVRCQTRIPGHFLKPQPTNGYQHVYLSTGKNAKWIYVHRLVLEAFIGPCPNKYEANHLDGKRANNYIDNLKWVTRSQNQQHSFDALGRKSKRISSPGESNPRAKLTNKKVLKIRKMYKTGNYSQRQLCRIFDVSKTVIQFVVCHKSWTHI